MSDESNTQNIDILNLVEEEEDQTNINEDKSDAGLNSQEEDKNVNGKNFSQIFGLNVNEALAKKSLSPSMILIISIESSLNQEDYFWKQKSVLNVITPDFIIVRLSKTNNVIEIMQFSSIFMIKSVPSLYVFGPYSQGVSYAWPDRYPTPSEFIQYVQQNLLNENQASSSNFSDLIIQPENQNSSASADQSSYNLHSLPNLSHPQSTNLNISNPIHSIYNPSPSHQETLISNSHSSQNMNTRSNDINSQNDNNNNNFNNYQSTSNTLKKSSSTNIHKKTARISIQVNGQHTVLEFQREAHVSDVVKAIESKFGRSYELYVPHLRRCIGFTFDELQRTISAADLAPSATIILRGSGDPGFSSNTISDGGYNSMYINDQNDQINDNDYHEPYVPPPSNSNRQFISNVGDDAQPSLEIDDNLPALGHTDTREVVPSNNINNDLENIHANQRTNEEQANQNRCGWSLIKKILSVVNPFGDIEEVEDFFETKEFRT